MIVAYFFFLFVSFDTVFSCKAKANWFPMVSDLEILPTVNWNQTSPTYSEFLQNVPKSVVFSFGKRKERLDMMKIELTRAYDDGGLWRLGGFSQENEFEGHTVWEDGAVLYVYVKKLRWGTRRNKRYD